MNHDRYTYLQAKASDITSYMDSDPFEYLTDDVLEVNTFVEAHSDRDVSPAYRVEFLLECGGPTTRIIVDSRWDSVKMHSTSGPDQSQSYDYDDALQLHGDDAAPWLMLAENMAEMA